MKLSNAQFSVLKKTKSGDLETTCFEATFDQCLLIQIYIVWVSHYKNKLFHKMSWDLTLLSAHRNVPVIITILILYAQQSHIFGAL